MPIYESKLVNFDIGLIMSIASEQEEYMRQHHKWTDKVRKIEEEISEAKTRGLDWKSMHENRLNHAKDQAQVNYELATDRGY